MASTKLEREDHARDAAFNKALHGDSAKARGGLRAMMSKDKAAQEAALDEYFKHWDKKPSADETEEIREARRAEYATLTRHYYNLATDMYEYGWGGSFHFCRFAYGEPFRQAIARHEHYLAHSIGLQEGQMVLDVGCGVGGPAREIAKFAGVNIVGLNNNDYQIERATRYAAKEGLSKQLRFTKGDFMQMSFEPNTFDAAYAIEATVHAPSLEGVYRQIYNSLKPGGVFGVYEWVMTDAYDNNNPVHREIRLGIEQGDGISNMVRATEALDAFKAAGFELIKAEDLADRGDDIPWYYPLAGSWKHMSSLWDVLTIARMTWWGRGLVHKFMGGMETIGLFPKGSQKTADSLAYAADCLVKGGEMKLFTPMYLMVGRKPE
ncbi:Delta(24)-sterol C-methyltransferase [Coccidioides posadasii str. Silveira]|uniref:Sterol 24-C-methyltransferase n=3 Tax=Coccidioides posadasii TaxID=199306 RepID=E9DEM3_COCPS|nr:S-adenosylmethionine:D24-methyltransferase, putative [Coccidioides posadasii C735 delta SOWgp]EER28241.1 S-adenosylmethionine:D24-methyltransferase, putative [Coccidioides posadasii C735 delta SOWgp]EFW15085.1 sterol 24-C-methyltransferase [Coccidioides posadasii str. Silveira]KMM68855.1 sterol 24-C-methyltransferase [Coccidioides posadasii RMSCC 3488]QVM09900.1 Delta(24)-sterol C-methyltransferase [Coccidioides posadasii str. Silveira]|eukprot:XP_003070386.1 S-adenosylmethionine:D24-methyltransferase, putative [Coccidioides posadasii C735 delta SOWgp]